MDSLGIDLRVNVWSCRNATGKHRTDLPYWACLIVVIAQLDIPTIPWHSMRKVQAM